MSEYLHIFDLDKTLIQVNCSFKYYCYLRKKKIYSFKSFLIAFLYFIKYKFFHYSPKALHKSIFNIFLKNRSEKNLFSDHAKDFFDKYFFSIINQKTLYFLKKAQEKKEKVLLLSNSPKYLIKEIAKRLDIKEYFGSSYFIDKKGLFKTIERIMDGDEKKRFVLNHIKDRKDIKVVAYSDSIWDRALLEIADKCYIVKPDRKLKKLAKIKGWELI